MTTPGEQPARRTESFGSPGGAPRAGVERVPAPGADGWDDEAGSGAGERPPRYTVSATEVTRPPSAADVTSPLGATSAVPAKPVAGERPPEAEPPTTATALPTGPAARTGGPLSAPPAASGPGGGAGRPPRWDIAPPPAWSRGPADRAAAPPRVDARPPARGAGSVAVRPAPAPAVRRGRLVLRRVDPWSVFRAGLVFAGCLFAVWMVAVGVLYSVLAGAGVFRSLNTTLNSTLNVTLPVSASGVLGVAAILGAFLAVLWAALVTVSAFAYNVTAALVGGIEVGLVDPE